jgi:hypothetical protein
VVEYIATKRQITMTYTEAFEDISGLMSMREAEVGLQHLLDVHCVGGWSAVWNGQPGAPALSLGAQDPRPGNS